MVGTEKYPERLPIALCKLQADTSHWFQIPSKVCKLLISSA